MNIDEMEVGRELDALVAEKVMGYQCVCDDEPRDCPIHAREDYDTLLAYSTDIATAEKIAKKLGFLIISDDDETSSLWYVASFDIVNVISSTVKMMPLVICRAALKLMEGKEDAHDQPLD